MNRPHELRRPTYNIWRNMIGRCTNPSHRSWKDYGGRGITVCPQWLNDVNQFIKDMGLKPDGLWLDRLDNDKGYSPTNCAWRTPKEQANNRRPSSRTRYITIEGETLTLQEWSVRTGVKPATIRSRIRNGEAESLWLYKGSLCRFKRGIPENGK